MLYIVISTCRVFRTRHQCSISLVQYLSHSFTHLSLLQILPPEPSGVTRWSSLYCSCISGGCGVSLCLILAVYMRWQIPVKVVSNNHATPTDSSWQVVPILFAQSIFFNCRSIGCWARVSIHSSYISVVKSKEAFGAKQVIRVQWCLRRKGYRALLPRPHIADTVCLFSFPLGKVKIILGLVCVHKVVGIVKSYL